MTHFKKARGYAALLAPLIMMLLLGCKGDPQPDINPKASDKTNEKTYTTKIVSARSLGTFDVKDPTTGEIQHIQCATCHGIARRPDEPTPKNMHATLVVKHGNNTCNTCHSDGNRSTLHLADGKTLAFEDTIELCAQCHGPQYRDYQHGSHGGMKGYWDRTKGPRTRNHCVNCHDPHAPAYPSVKPAPGPQDRFLTPHSKKKDH